MDHLYSSPEVSYNYSHVTPIVDLYVFGTTNPVGISAFVLDSKNRVDNNENFMTKFDD